jgi:dUTP pyrophosphatase
MSATFNLGSGLKGIFITPTYALHVKKLDDNARLPEKAHHGDLGFDLFALEDTILLPGKVTKVRTGIACGFPFGYGALIRDRSSVATKQEVFVCAGVIDNGYTGEIIVAMFNPGKVETLLRNELDGWRTLTVQYVGAKEFKAGDKIAQMILTPVVNFPIIETDDLSKTSRGANGFGSTGK